MPTANAAPGRLPCSHCGAKIAVPPGHDRPKIRCDACGYYVPVPPEMRSAEPPPPADDDLPVITPAAADRPKPPRPPDADRPRTKPKKPTATARANPNPRDPRADFHIDDDAPRGPDLLEGTQEEDDDQPYAVPGDGTKACPACNCRLPLDAALCVHCGTDLHTRRKSKKGFQPISREWEPRWDLKFRLQVFAGLQVMNVLLMVLVTGAAGFAAGVLSLILQGALHAFLIGSFEKIAVKRTAKGQATLTKHWRIAFVPVAPQKIDWKQSHGLGSIATHSAGFLEWMTFAYLFLLLIVPGLLFYFIVMHPLRFQVVLCDVYGSTEQTIFRTTSQEQSEEVCATVATATGLTYRPVI